MSLPASVLGAAQPITTALDAVDNLTDTTEPGAGEALTGTAEVAAALETTIDELAAITPTVETTGAATSEIATTVGLSATELLSDVLVTPPMAQVPVTLELILDMVVTDTLTSTVPATVMLQLPDLTTTTMPVSVTVGVLPGNEVVIELLPAAEIETPTTEPTEVVTETATPEPTVIVTATVTPEPEVTATVTPTAAAPTPVIGLPIITSTATTTANLRSGPATTLIAWAR
ncbi:MAG: hypothetical protein IPK16_03280 [Anaerolineales bacterium]|nr:hypothetical protein [Anaerolineales bacterium]